MDSQSVVKLYERKNLAIGIQPVFRIALGIRTVIELSINTLSVAGCLVYVAFINYAHTVSR
jgi:hypothetical protein